jgi:cell shape-determining protein MreC
LAVMLQELNESERKRAEKVSASPTNSLFIPDLIEARVIGRETVALHAGRKILGIGKAKGVGENLLVVDTKYSTLDIGKDQGLAIHAPVFAGHTVVGRTINCGGYSCSLQPVTDSQFVGAAQLMRGTATGLRPGSEGMVEGSGQKRCRLTGVWRRASVEVGDEVYTPAEDPLIPYPMYYGKVVRADLPEGAAHWIIELEPAANDMRLKHVHVLKPTENTLRVLAN